VTLSDFNISTCVDVPSFAWTDQNGAIQLPMRSYVSFFLRNERN
jgi:hypothetical protein